MNLSWQNGRQLHIVSQPSGNSSYYYDASGARYQKISKGVTTTYHLVDGVAYSEKRSNGIELQYLYDENGSVYGIRKNGILYYFLFNGQGDVIGIYDEYKTLQARYEYDAWGKLLSVKNASGATITSATHIGNINPFRYRGYYYDVETGFYYLNSRYYDPEVKRFLTMDDTDVITATTDGTTDKNLFAYCDNNPINRVDESGFFWKSVAETFAKVAVAATVVVAVAAITVATGGAGAAVLAAGGTAAMASAATAGVVAVGTAAACTAASAAIGTGMAIAADHIQRAEIVKENGVTVESYYPNDHGNPAHLHVKGGGPDTKIGPQGKPVKGYPQLSAKQRKVVLDNIKPIKKAIRDIQKWLKQQISSMK